MAGMSVQKQEGKVHRINYIFKRVGQIIPVLFIITILIFTMIRLIPGDPARLVLGEKATESAVAALREELGLNKPMVTQYFIFLKQVMTFDLGKSITYQTDVTTLIKDRIGVTLYLTIASALFSLLISVPLGYYAGMKKDKLGDQAVRVGALAAISMPSFWIGLLLMMFFGVKLKILPVGGWGVTFIEKVKAIILPALTQSLMTTALLVRNIRNSVVDINRLDYVDFARSKRITEREVKYRHIMRNAMISTVTLLAMRVAYMLGGSVIIETVFSLPGIGKLLVESIFSRDYAVVQSLVLVFSFVVLIVNLITDVIYSFLDPRVSL